LLGSAAPPARQTITLIGTSAAMREHLPDALGDFLASHPQVNVTVAGAASEDCSPGVVGLECCGSVSSPDEPRRQCGRSSRWRRDASQIEEISARDELECWDVEWTGYRTAWPATRFQQGVDR
jgi:DNA-binding transcriptional LysR family regulator